MKRQEKLSDIFQALTLGEQEHNEEHPLSLIANRVRVVPDELGKPAEQKNSISNTLQTLMQKFHQVRGFQLSPSLARN